MSGIRINKYVASSGFCSRREADKLVESGKVTIDGKIAVAGSQVVKGQVVKVADEVIIPVQQNEHIYIALNKPLGITCTTDRRDEDNIIDFLGIEKRVFTIGRLDKNSSGLILLTDDGDIVNKLLRAENNHEKEYVVKVDKPLQPDFKKRMENGLPILDRITLPCEVQIRGKQSFSIVLHQGLNRQIRRMCEYLGYRVVKLKRIRFLCINLGDMRPGEYRYLIPNEIKELKRLTMEK